MQGISIPATTPRENDDNIKKDIRSKLEIVRLYTRFFKELEKKIYGDESVIELLRKLYSKRPSLFQTGLRESDESFEGEEGEEDVLKPLYRRVAMKLHPDRKGGDEEKFKEVKDVYKQGDVDRLITIAEEIGVSVGNVGVNQAQLQRQINTLVYNLFNVSIFGLGIVEITEIFYGEDLNDDNFDILFERLFNVLRNKVKLRIISELK